MSNFRMPLSELSFDSRSLSSSTSSLSSTLSQSSSSSAVQNLTEMAEMMRKRIHSTTSSLTIPFLGKKHDSEYLEIKENKMKSFKYKRQKISSFINENLLKKEPLENQLIDLPKPQPVSIIKILFQNTTF